MDKLLAVCDVDLRGLRNKALLFLAYDSMRRRTELVSLRAADIQMTDEGKCSILLRKRKSDQTGSGHWIHLSHETTIELNNWLHVANFCNGVILRRIQTGNRTCSELGASQVSRIFKSLARTAELNDEVVKGISGHSMRVGAAQDLLMSGVSLPQIMVKGGWSKTDTVMRYIDKVRPHNSVLKTY